MGSRTITTCDSCGQESGTWGVPWLQVTSYWKTQQGGGFVPCMNPPAPLHFCGWPCLIGYVDDVRSRFEEKPERED